ncbi:MAG: shikimate kinase [Deltaproteobacteria bacterium]|nr:shikimate kinase [Deltaproteobacteria bacterium]
MIKKSIILIGMAGVGKSTTGRLLAQHLAWRFVELDQCIKDWAGKSKTQEIIDNIGEQAFMQIEKNIMYQVDLRNVVVATGGSVIYHSDLMDYLKESCVLLYLRDSFENIFERWKLRGTGGVIGLRDKSFREVFEERQPLYAHHADVVVDVNGKSTGEIVADIISIV